MLNILMQTNTGASGVGMIGQLLPFILIGFVFYFLLIRPQNKRMKEHKAMLAAVTRGDTVVTSGGLVGKVTKVTDDELTIDAGSGVKLKVMKHMLNDVRNSTVAANDSGKKK